jgi:hypothetical protein
VDHVPQHGDCICAFRAIRSVEAIIDNIRNFHAKALSTVEATVQDAQAEVDLLKKDEGGNK